MTFMVTLSKRSEETVSVNYATSDGTAEAGKDYTAKSGMVWFSSGEKTKTCKVKIRPDNSDDEDDVEPLFSGQTTWDT